MTPLIAVLCLAASPTLKLEGDLVKPATLSVNELEAHGAVAVDFKDKSGEHRGIGVRLDKVLLKQGFAEGPMGPQVNPKQKHEGLRAAVIATASDGFEAVFSMGELLETLGATNAVLVWEMDGKPLPDAVGPFRLVVTTDKGSSRSLHQLTSLRVVNLKAK
jgi:DMSO/TMAO reductase YedYZ molybdopterin-dependent catalytic subunit